MSPRAHICPTKVPALPDRIRIKDFNPIEGDRIAVYVRGPESYSAEELFSSGVLQFDATTGELELDFDPSTSPSANNVFILPGVESFDPAWISIV